VKRVCVAGAMVALLVAGCTAAPPRVAGTTPLPSVETTEIQDTATAETIPQWPPVSVPPVEMFTRIGECLSGEGFAVDVNVQAYTVEYSGEQHEAYRAALDACVESIDPSYLTDPPDFTAEQLQDLYGYVLDQVNCYVELGYPQVELPSFDLFIDELRGRFDPVAALSTQGALPDEAEMIMCRGRAKPPWFMP